jgi:hypothetical protein
MKEEFTMISRTKIIFIFIISMIWWSTWNLTAMPGYPEQEEKQDSLQQKQALMNVAKLLNRPPEQLHILNQRTLQIPFVEGTYQGYKILDQEKDEGILLLMDNRGRRVSYEELIEQSKKNKFDRMGHLHPYLFQIMEKKQTEIDELPVIIKFRIEEPIIDKSKYPSEPQLQTQKMTRDEELYQKKLIENFRTIGTELDKLQIKTMFELPKTSPFLSVDLSIDEIRKLSRSPVVDFIALTAEPIVYDYPTITESLPTTLTDYVHNRGYKGSGIKICILESGGLDKDESCFNIADIQTTSSSDPHITNSAGIIGNRFKIISFPPFFEFEFCGGSSWDGYAPEANVYIANDGDYTDAYDWAKSKGVNVITMSWHNYSEETNGSLHARDIYFDYAVTHWPYPTIFTSAGNQAGAGAYASGKGYNFFGVANVENDGDGNRSNDVIASSSSWKNPTSPHSDREVPEIAAPGSRHALLGRSFGGTSCATPIAASIATLLMDRNSKLRIWPEAIRPILLATANYQNSDGANWSSWSDGKDGTGLINTQYAYWTAGRRQTDDFPMYRAHDYGTLRSSSFSEGYLNERWYAKSIGGSNSKIRIAFTWNSKTDGTTSELDADLDLWVYDPNNNLIARSQTWDSNYEFVEFAAPTAGTYTIKIRGFRVPSDLFTYFGVAWTAHYD